MKYLCVVFSAVCISYVGYNSSRCLEFYLKNNPAGIWLNTTTVASGQHWVGLHKPDKKKQTMDIPVEDHSKLRAEQSTAD